MRSAGRTEGMSEIRHQLSNCVVSDAALFGGIAIPIMGTLCKHYTPETPERGWHDVCSFSAINRWISPGHSGVERRHEQLTKDKANMLVRHNPLSEKSGTGRAISPDARPPPLSMRASRSVSDPRMYRTPRRLRPIADAGPPSA